MEILAVKFSTLARALPWCRVPKEATAAAAAAAEEEATEGKGEEAIRDLARTGRTADWEAATGLKLPPMMLSMEKGDLPRAELVLAAAACKEAVRDGLSWAG